LIKKKKKKKKYLNNRYRSEFDNLYAQMFRPLVKKDFLTNLTKRNYASLKQNGTQKMSISMPPIKSTRQELSNRKKFRQINPPPSILKEIEALGLGKPRKIKISRFATKVAIVERKKLENNLGKLEILQEGLEVTVKLNC
jgi:hypothetical protein